MGQDGGVNALLNGGHTDVIGVSYRLLSVIDSIRFQCLDRLYGPVRPSVGLIVVHPYPNLITKCISHQLHRFARHPECSSPI